jgi:putative radical SAM enzyme (TIGR03279 family)
MSRPRVLAVVEGSPAHAAGVQVGDEITGIDGQLPRDVIQWQMLVDEPDPEISIDRSGIERTLEVSKAAGVPLGVEVDAALFDRVQTCDNHCPFCFIYQLPKGMRRSLYLKDDDYRLSFLYGNFTTLTRFTEADLERVISEQLSPLYVSIHATDPDVRSGLLRNRRGALSLRWLRVLLDHGIDVHGQVVVCPGVNDGDVLDDTLCGVLDQYPELISVAVVPLGVSQFSNEPTMRPHTADEASTVLDIVEGWQATFSAVLGRALVFASDEYYILAGRPFPPRESYGDFDMHEDGIGMARAFEAEFHGEAETPIGVQSGFFHAVDGAPATGYRAPRTGEGCGPNPGGEYQAGDLPDDEESFGGSTSEVPHQDVGVLASSPAQAVAVDLKPRRGANTSVLTSKYGATVISPLIESLGRADIRVTEVDNEFFGGNIGVTGLMVGADLIRVLAAEPTGDRYLLPDVCLTGGRFLDGLTTDDLPRRVEIVGTDGFALRQALEQR